MGRWLSAGGGGAREKWAQKLLLVGALPVVEGLEFFENVLLEVLRDADAGVLDLDFQEVLVRVVRADEQLDGPIERVLEGIGKEVDQYLLDSDGVRVKEQAFCVRPIRLNDELDLFLLELDFEKILDLFEELAQRELLSYQPNF